MKPSIPIILLACLCGATPRLLAQSRLPDTGQITSYTTAHGEDADYVIHPPSFTDNGDGTVTDNNTGLMWQKTDGGEMTYDNAEQYCASLSLGGYTDWRLPGCHELFGINNYNTINPALNTTFFTKTAAEYWWGSEARTDDATKIWVVNAGGGVGAHPKSETVSAGGAKRFHVRAVRTVITHPSPATRFTDNGNGTVTDNLTRLVWQKTPSSATMTWEEALAYASGLALAGKTDWRVPNVKELQSLNDETLSKPSIPKSFINGIASGNYWSSTTMYQQAGVAWDINVEYGIVSYNTKTVKEYALCVRGGMDRASFNISEALIPAGQYDMGDHFGFVDPAHPSDEVPIHSVRVDSFYLAKTLATNGQFLAFLNASLLDGSIEVRNNMAYRKGDTNALCFTNQSAAYYSIGYDGKVFSMADFRENHPVVGVLWSGAAAFCNWLSAQDGYTPCYNLATWACNFDNSGYRLPTEAEWEWAGRGGHINPYYNYVFGNTIDVTKANLPQSGDPYETASLPNTTPVGFYDGTLKVKTQYNWPGAAASYQTGDGANEYGLYDMQGNVWEFLNDWYGQNYYSVSSTDNPKGPTSGSLMPDGLPYRGVRGGNWYNGLVVNGVNDGHSRVSNRNPSYYRGPGDANAPWHHTGFRTARKYDRSVTGLESPDRAAPQGFRLSRNHPNPFSTTTTLECALPATAAVSMRVLDLLGRVVSTREFGVLRPGIHTMTFDGSRLQHGVYYLQIQAGAQTSTVTIHHMQ
jgi:formylglycine-generating enzyme required for sulfatase activity